MRTLIWAYVNHARYGTAHDRQALEQNLGWIRNRFCIGKPGEYWSHSGGWYDVFALKNPVLFTHMQGEFAVSLR
jgi:hypothetical protein